MIAHLYLTGRLSAEPQIAQTKKGRPFARILLEAEQIRPSPNGAQVETIMLPVVLFSHQAEAIRSSRKGDALTIAAHFNGTKFETEDGIVKHGVQLIADTVLWEREGA